MSTHLVSKKRSREDVSRRVGLAVGSGGDSGSPRESRVGREGGGLRPSASRSVASDVSSDDFLKVRVTVEEDVVLV